MHDHDPYHGSFRDRLRARSAYVSAWAWLAVKYLLVSVVLLFVMFSLFFVATGAIGLTDENAFGWLFGGWLLVYIGLVAMYGNHLKADLRQRWARR